jgi:hypothetical protein
MWPFKSKLKNEKEQIAKLFTDYVSEKVIDDSGAGKLELNKLEEIEVDYLLILQSDDTSEPVGHPVEKVLDLIEKHDGMVESITNYLIIVLFGVPFKQDDSHLKRKSLVKELGGSMGNYLSIVHGHAKCQVGIIGNKNRHAYTAIIPSFKEKLQVLSSQDFGQHLEIK